MLDFAVGQRIKNFIEVRAYGDRNSTAVKTTYPPSALEGTIIDLFKKRMIVRTLQGTISITKEQWSNLRTVTRPPLIGEWVRSVEKPEEFGLVESETINFFNVRLFDVESNMFKLGVPGYFMKDKTVVLEDQEIVGYSLSIQQEKEEIRAEGFIRTKIFPGRTLPTDWGYQAATAYIEESPDIYLYKIILDTTKKQVKLEGMGQLLISIALKKVEREKSPKIEPIILPKRIMFNGVEKEL